MSKYYVTCYQAAFALCMNNQIKMYKFSMDFLLNKILRTYARTHIHIHTQLAVNDAWWINPAFHIWVLVFFSYWSRSTLNSITLEWMVCIYMLIFIMYCIVYIMSYSISILRIFNWLNVENWIIYYLSQKHTCL